MKRILVVLVALLAFSTITAFGQNIRASKVFPDGVQTTGTTGGEETGNMNMLILTSQIPVSFIRLEANDSGSMDIKGQMSVGASYVLMYGQGKLEADKSVSGFRPYVFGGPVVTFDTVAGSTIYTGFSAGVVIGINPMSAIIAYDLGAKKMVYGFGMKIEIGNMTDLTTTVLKKWLIVP